MPIANNVYFFFFILQWANTQTCYVIFFLTISSCAICPRGKQYFNENLEKCVNCTKCDTEQHPIVIRPCAYNHDTECGTHEQLNKILETFGQKLPVHIRHMNKKHHRPHDDIILTFNENSVGSDGSNEATTNKYNEEAYMEFRRATEPPFTKAETIVWDWQSITMTLAVFSCILFFLVIALYSLHQARQWKKLKENFDAGMLIIIIIFITSLFNRNKWFTMTQQLFHTYRRSMTFYTKLSLVITISSKPLIISFCNTSFMIHLLWFNSKKLIQHFYLINKGYVVLNLYRGHVI